MQKQLKRFLALLLTAVLLLPAARIPASAESPAVLRIALFSDPHYFPEELAGGYGDAFKEGQIIGHPIEQTPGVLRSVLAAIKARALRGEIDYLLIPGDLTREGEYIGHVRLAEILRQFEKETGIPVAVIPGNHDIDNGGASDFSNGVKEKARQMTWEEFYENYKDLGFDLPNCERFVSGSESRDGKLSYAADLGDKYRLIALDTSVRRINADLRAWTVDQCEKAEAAGKTIVAMGHHNLNEQLKGQLIVMQNQGVENMRDVSEEFADAGMHFYFSGHLHMSEISPWYSDKGEVLYDVIVPGLYSFPGDYRVVGFSALDGRVEAKIRSYAPDEALPMVSNGVAYAPYYPASLRYSFGYGGEGMVGFVKAMTRRELTKQLNDLQKKGGITKMVKDNVDLGPLNALFEYLDERLINRPGAIIDILESVIDDAFALPVSKLPCTRFIGELGFGDAKKPGTVEDLATSAIVYMFWKKHDPSGDLFVQDVLRRLKNGELLDQILNYALPKVLDVVGAEIVPLLAGVDVQAVNCALQGALGTVSFPLLFILALLPGTRATISAELYKLASEIMTSSSPSGNGVEADLVYGGAVDTPTGPNTFRLPYDLSAAMSADKKSAEITWYTKASLVSPKIHVTDEADKDVPGLSVGISSEPVEIMVNEIDLGVARLMGQKLFAVKHTAAVKGLDPSKSYRFTAGDSKFGWYSEPRALYVRATPVLDFFRQVWEWFLGLFRLLGIVWNNREYY